jgi:hypothetical protein
MRKVVRKDAPKKEMRQSKEHWSDRYKILISIVIWVVLIGAFVFLMYVGDSIR